MSLATGLMFLYYTNTIFSFCKPSSGEMNVKLKRTIINSPLIEWRVSVERLARSVYMNNDSYINVF